MLLWYYDSESAITHREVKLAQSMSVEPAKSMFVEFVISQLLVEHADFMRLSMRSNCKRISGVEFGSRVNHRSTDHQPKSGHRSTTGLSMTGDKSLQSLYLIGGVD